MQLESSIDQITNLSEVRKKIYAKGREMRRQIASPRSTGPYTTSTMNTTNTTNTTSTQHAGIGEDTTEGATEGATPQRPPGGARRSPRSRKARAPPVPLAERPPFSPCNPGVAKEAVTKGRAIGGVNQGTPYGAERAKAREAMHQAKAKRLNGVFRPCAPAEAQEQIQVKYYLNSADAAALAAEKKYIKKKAKRNYRDFIFHTQGQHMSARPEMPMRVTQGGGSMG